MSADLRNAIRDGRLIKAGRRAIKAAKVRAETVERLDAADRKVLDREAPRQSWRGGRRSFGFPLK